MRESMNEPESTRNARVCGGEVAEWKFAFVIRSGAFGNGKGTRRSPIVSNFAGQLLIKSWRFEAVRFKIRVARASRRVLSREREREREQLQSR